MPQGLEHQRCISWGPESRALERQFSVSEKPERLCVVTACTNPQQQLCCVFGSSWNYFTVLHITTSKSKVLNADDGIAGKFSRNFLELTLTSIHSVPRIYWSRVAQRGRDFRVGALQVINRERMRDGAGLQRNAPRGLKDV